MAKVLVTGGTGFIGSHTSVELIKKGHDVIIIDNLSNSSETALDGIASITGVRPSFKLLDICDKEAVHAFFSENRDIDAVIHFAAYKAVGESVAKPLKYYRNNLVNLISLLECMTEFGIDNIIFSSSATVYGQPDTLPATENSPIQPAESPYGNTKQICEEIIRDTVFANASLSAVSLRYFNPIGAHESAHIGELPLGVPNNLMPFITQTAIGKRKELKVFGDDYDTKDGTAVRDYIHVVDLSIAHVTAVERLLTGDNKKKFEIFNLGTGKGCSVLEVIESFERSTNVKLNYQMADRRPGDVEQIFASTSHANDELGWNAERSLDQMTKSAWDWEKKLAEME